MGLRAAVCVGQGGGVSVGRQAGAGPGPSPPHPPFLRYLKRTEISAELAAAQERLTVDETKRRTDTASLLSQLNTALQENTDLEAHQRTVTASRDGLQVGSPRVASLAATSLLCPLRLRSPATHTPLPTSRRPSML